MNYGEWKETARLVHMSLQMAGKVKVEKMAPQPEWNHVLLNLTPPGFYHRRHTRCPDML